MFTQVLTRLDTKVSRRMVEKLNPVKSTKLGQQRMPIFARTSQGWPRVPAVPASG